MELGGKQVMETAEDYLLNCANMKVDIEASERLMEPENREISLRYILKYSRGAKGTLRGKQKTMVGESGEEGSTARRLAQ